MIQIKADGQHELLIFEGPVLLPPALVEEYDGGNFWIIPTLHGFTPVLMCGSASGWTMSDVEH